VNRNQAKWAYENGTVSLRATEDAARKTALVVEIGKTGRGSGAVDD